MDAAAPRPAGLRALVVDDEAPARSELAYLLGADARVGAVRTASGARDAVAVVSAGDVDVLFCDVKMPGTDGVQLARAVSSLPSPPAVVFVTAYEEHAVDAFDLRAVDYVLKPVRPERLAEAVRRAADQVQADHAPPAAGDPRPDEEQVPVELGGVTRFVPRAQVAWVEAQGDYARLHTAAGSHLLRVPLTTLEQRWSDAGFVRIHRSTLVALRHVAAVHVRDGHCVVEVGGGELVVSRRHTRALRDRLRERRPSAAPPADTGQQR